MIHEKRFTEKQLLIVRSNDASLTINKDLEDSIKKVLVTKDFEGKFGKIKAALHMIPSTIPITQTISQIKKFQKIDPAERAIYADSLKDLVIDVVKKLYQTDLPQMIPEALIISPNDPQLNDYQCSEGNFLLNTLYARHPASPNYFLKLSGFHEKLLNEKRNEFVQLLISLGAKRISLIDGKQKNKDRKLSGTLNTPVNELDIGGKAEINRSTSSQINIEGEFELPKNPPSVPKELKWFEQEDSWKTIAHGRLNGNGMKKYEVHFTYDKNSIIAPKLVTKLKGFGVDIEGKFASSGSVNKEYSIEFYSRDDYANITE